MTRNALTATLSLLLLSACSHDLDRSPAPGQGAPDLVAFLDDSWGGDWQGDDAGARGTADPCGDAIDDTTCHDSAYAPPFALQSDATKNPLEGDLGLARDGDGYLGLDAVHTVANYLWLANHQDNGGTVSKVDSVTVREVARYRSTTCYSLKTASTDPCDGTKGCCALDDWQRYQARKNKQKEPGHQAVQLLSNDPSRTAVDFNGDLFVSNRAFGGQSSVTKIANTAAGCIDRNHNGRIETSSDSNGDGFIQEDCNGDGQPDDTASVKARPCTNKVPQEFYGNDDECVLWTSNTFVPQATGRPLALAAGQNALVSDAWAGSFNNGNFVRIDGVTGLDKDDVQLPQDCYGGTGPYGAAVDANGYAWVTPLGSGKACYFDTRNHDNVGVVRDPKWGSVQGYGITLDRDQNVWFGSGVARYTPDWSNGFNNLGNGWWTQIAGRGGIGIAADSRSAKEYFVWSCEFGTVLRIPASTIKVLKIDQTIMSAGWPSITIDCYGVGVDSDQNIWGISMAKSTRALVDAKGNITQPVVAPPKGNNLCPAGDSCPNPGAYTYSDFTGFGLRNFTRPTGSYTMIVKGCTDSDGNPADTEWWQLNWDADVPPNTTLVVHAKSGAALTLNDPSWMQDAFTTDTSTSPLDLKGQLVPNAIPGQTVNDPYLFVEFVLKTASADVTPKLKAFDVGFKCHSGGPG